jgi:hypothetical protein
MRIGFAGTAMQVQWRMLDRTVKFAMNGHDMLMWSLGPDDRSYPSSVSYIERDFYGKEIAHARFDLKSVKSSPSNLVQTDFIPASKVVTVTKDGSGYGPFDASKDGDPWDFYQHNNQMWQARDAATKPAKAVSWLPVAAVGLVVMAALVFLLVRKRK